MSKHLISIAAVRTNSFSNAKIGVNEILVPASPGWGYRRQSHTLPWRGEGASMNRKFFCLNDKKYLERSSATAFFAMRPDSKTVYWVDITQPDPASLTEFLSPLQLHPLVLDECLDPAAGSHIAPYEESLFVKLLIQPGRDNLSQSYLSIICLPHSVITVHDSPVAALKCIETKFSTGVLGVDLRRVAVAVDEVVPEGARRRVQHDIVHGGRLASE